MARAFVFFIRRLRPFFGDSQFRISKLREGGGGVQKNDYFLGYVEIVNIFGFITNLSFLYMLFFFS